MQRRRRRPWCATQASERPRVAQALRVAARVVGRPLGVAVGARRAAARAPRPTSIRSMSGASSPTRRAMPRVHGHQRARAARPTTTLRAVVRRARSRRSPPPGSPPERIAVRGAESCASFTARRMRSRSRARQPLQRRRLDVDRRPLDAELRGEARRAAHDVLAAGVRADAAQQRRLGLPHALDRLVGAIRLHVVLDAVGGAAQRELAQRDQVALAEEVAPPRARPAPAGRPCPPRGARAARRPETSTSSTSSARSKNVSGTVSRTRDAGDAADDVVQALEVLDVERREDVDAGREQLLDVLPALRMARARRVGVRELVDEDQRRMARERGVEIELAAACGPGSRASRGGSTVRPGEQRLGLRAAVRLDEADDDVACPRRAARAPPRASRTSCRRPRRRRRRCAGARAAPIASLRLDLRRAARRDRAVSVACVGACDGAPSV